MRLEALRKFLRYVVMEFGALIVFWIGLYGVGIKAAIAATVIFVALDALYRWRWRIPVTRIYVLTSTLAIVFGAIAPTLVAWFVVAPLKHQPIAGGWKPAAMTIGPIVNACWGFGTALFYRLFSGRR